MPQDLPFVALVGSVLPYPPLCSVQAFIPSLGVICGETQKNQFPAQPDNVRNFLQDRKNGYKFGFIFMLSGACEVQGIECTVETIERIWPVRV